MTMMIPTTEDLFDAFDQDLIDRRVILNVLEYAKLHSERFYPTLDLEFVRDLSGFVNKHVPCIPHQHLVDYKVCGKKISNVKDMIAINELVEGRDYVLTIRCDESTRGKPKHTYLFHPTAFQWC